MIESVLGKSVAANLSTGGTVDGDLTVTGSLGVGGDVSINLTSVVSNSTIIDATGTEALLVRKNGDGGDVFVVDTTNSKAVIAGNLVVGTNNLEKLQFHDDNVGLQRASGSNRASNGNSLYVSAFEDIVFTASGAAMGSQTED